jgi:microcystin-dependent protein
MKTTPIYALPSPDETDSADVPRDVQALAQRVEAVLPNVGMPTGAGVDWYAAAAPAGFLLCDGSAVSRATYAALFAAIGTIWGGGDGINTFNLPDTRGRVLVGLGAHADVAALGQNEGSTALNRRPRHPHSLAGAPGVGNLQLPDHQHSVNDPGHWHNFTSNDSGGPNVPHSSASQDTTYTSSGGIGGTADGPVRSAATGLSVAGVTSHPGISGAPTVGTLTVGVVGSALDTPAYVVAAKVIKT